jgi:hypothetical protein
MNLEEELINKAGNQMSAAIDFEILSNMLVEACGWYKAEIINLPTDKTSMDVLEWIDKHCKGKHMRNQRSYIFENQGDAVNFTLRWL